MSIPFKFRYANRMAGILVIVAVLLFVIGVILAGRAQGWFEGQFSMVATFKTEQGTFGLLEGDEAWVMNTVAGRVNSIRPTQAGYMQARFELKKRFQPLVRTDSVAIVKKKFGIAGDSYVEIQEGKGEPVRDGAAIECRRDEDVLETARKVLGDVQAQIAPVLDGLKQIVTNVTGSVPFTDTRWRSTSMRTGPASSTAGSSSSGSPVRRMTARMRATSSRDENGLVT